jgi:hypothetical protein
MKINDLEVKKLNEGPIGTAIGAGLGAMAGGPLGAAAGGVAGNWVGDKLSKAASGLKGAGKSFMQGFKGEKPAAGANATLKPIQDAIARLSPQQRTAIRTMAAKRAGVK